MYTVFHLAEILKLRFYTCFLNRGVTRYIPRNPTSKNRSIRQELSFYKQGLTTVESQSPLNILCHALINHVATVQSYLLGSLHSLQESGIYIVIYRYQWFQRDAPQIGKPENLMRVTSPFPISLYVNSATQLYNCFKGALTPNWDDICTCVSTCVTLEKNCLLSTSLWNCHQELKTGECMQHVSMMLFRS